MKTLIIFTDSFPYGKGEQYLLNELPYYSNNFDKIIFIPINTQGKIRQIPTNSEVLNIHLHIKKKLKIQYALLLPMFFIHLLSELYFRKDTSPLLKIKNHYKSFLNAYFYSKTIVSVLKIDKSNSKSFTFYSYWFYHWAYVISLIQRMFPDTRSYSRAHLNDVYDYLKYNYWVGTKLKILTTIFSISDHATNYFRYKYPVSRNKVITHRLGVNKTGVNPVFKQVSKFTIVSCSSIRKEKRLDFIIDVLSNVKDEIEWIHFGDGPLYEQIKNKAKSNLHKNVKYTFKGFANNNDVLDFYQTNHIDLFINLSSEEGIPVSLMEAISFGIPVVGTDVFGTPELVNETTGLLIDLNSPAGNVAEKISHFLNESIDREKIIDFYNQHYNAKKNYTNFSKLIS